MQAHDSDDQRPEEKPADGRRDVERSAVQDADGVASAPVPDVGNRTVCLSANIIGKGGVAS